MNKLGVRVVLAILVGTILGYSIAVGPGLYQQWKDHRALLDAMATNPAYKVIDIVESYNPRITVLNVIEDDESGAVIMWLIHDESGITQEEWIPYLVDTLAHLFESLMDIYPNHSAYALVFGQASDINTIEGVKTGIVSRGVYIMPSQSISMFLSEPTIESLDFLYSRGLFLFERPSLTLADVLPREPGFIWPWSGDDDCNTCP